MAAEKSLSEVLGELHEALEAETRLDDAERAELRQAADEIRAALDESHGSEALRTLRDKLTDAVERFEGSYPRLTAVVGRMADALADLGI